MLHLPSNYMEQGRNEFGLNTKQVYICTVITEKNIALVLI